MNESINTRKLAADQAVEHVKNGMTVGLGTGTTAYWAIQEIGARVAQGLQIKAVATSLQSETLALKLAIPIIPISAVQHFDVTVDGADEVDHDLNVIKGGGGALLREKIIGAATKLYIIIADEQKLVGQLGLFPLPVEVVRFGWELAFYKLQALGCTPVLRMLEGEPYLTDNDHYIIDCSFFHIAHAQQLQAAIKGIPGVVEDGLFLKMADIVILGKKDGTTQVLNRQKN